jgi:hypothetical protein
MRYDLLCQKMVKEQLYLSDWSMVPIERSQCAAGVVQTPTPEAHQTVFNRIFILSIEELSVQADRGLKPNWSYKYRASTRHQRSSQAGRPRFLVLQYEGPPWLADKQHQHVAQP